MNQPVDTSSHFDVSVAGMLTRNQHMLFDRFSKYIFENVNDYSGETGQFPDLKDSFRCSQ